MGNAIAQDSTRQQLIPVLCRQRPHMAPIDECSRLCPSRLLSIKGGGLLQGFQLIKAASRPRFERLNSLPLPNLRDFPSAVVVASLEAWNA
jgi:hypothetical protein